MTTSPTRTATVGADLQPCRTDGHAPGPQVPQTGAVDTSATEGMRARHLVIGIVLVALGLAAGILAAAHLAADRDGPRVAAPVDVARAGAGSGDDGLAAAWTEATVRAVAARTDAQETLTATAGQVDDDAVRATLADAVAAVRTAEEAEASPEMLLRLDDVVAALGPAVAAVRQSHRIWSVDNPDLAPPHPDSRTVTSSGPGPDCGGPDSAEPPPEEGPTFFTSTPPATGDGSNGRIPRSQLAALPWCADAMGNQQWLRPDAADGLVALNEEFRAVFGENIAIYLSYRSYADQVAMREVYGSLAADPGSSNHGLGTAVDVWEWQAYAFGSDRHRWLVEHGPEDGWVAPEWAREGGSNPEYWHFEYVG